MIKLEKFDDYAYECFDARTNKFFPDAYVNYNLSYENGKGVFHDMILYLDAEGIYVSIIDLSNNKVHDYHYPCNAHEANQWLMNYNEAIIFNKSHFESSAGKWKKAKHSKHLQAD